MFGQSWLSSSSLSHALSTSELKVSVLNRRLLETESSIGYWIPPQASTCSGLIGRSCSAAGQRNTSLLGDQNRILEPDSKPNLSTNLVRLLTCHIDALDHVSGTTRWSGLFLVVGRLTGSFETTSPIFSFSLFAPFRYGCSCISKPNPWPSRCV